MKRIYLEKFKVSSNVIAYGPTMVKNNELEILKKFNLKKNQFYLIVGRLIPDNNSKLIIEGFLDSGSSKKIVIVGDVPYNDDYAKSVKNYRSKKVIFTGYIKDNSALSNLYRHSFGYIHGHEYGGTNPTMINALFLNKEILALKTKFNREMLEGKETIFFNKNKNQFQVQ